MTTFRAFGFEVFVEILPAQGTSPWYEYEAYANGYDHEITFFRIHIYATHQGKLNAARSRHKGRN